MRIPVLFVFQEIVRIDVKRCKTHRKGLGTVGAVTDMYRHSWPHNGKVVFQQEV